MALTKIKTQSINDDAITTAKINNNAVTDAKVADDITAGAATTAATLATARNIGGVSFNGSSAINLPGVNTAGSQDTTGNAATATVLATTRAINGVNFNGSAAITVTADANTLSNTTLKSTVVTSSLTSVGTLSSLTLGGDLNIPEYVKHIGDTDTFIRFIDGGIAFSCDNTTPLVLDATSGTGMAVGGDATFSGNVGIGTTSPTGLLEIKDATGDSDTFAKAVHILADDGSINNSGDIVGMLCFSGRNSGGTGKPVGIISGMSNSTWIESQSHGWGGLHFQVGSGASLIDRMTMNATGVGIGNASPTEMLHLKSGTSAKPVMVIENTNADGDAGKIQFIKDGGSAANDDTIGAIQFNADDSDGNVLNFANMFVYTSNAVNGQEQSKINFSTRDGGAEKIPLTLKGSYVGIAEAAPDTPLHVSSAAASTVKLVAPNSVGGPYIIFNNDSSTIGYVGQAGGHLTGGSTNLGIRAEGALLLGTNGNNTRVTVASDGHVTLSQKLTVSSDFNQTYGDAKLYSSVMFGTTTNTAQWEDTSGNGSMYYQQHSASQNTGLRISSDTSVGYAMFYVNAINGANDERYFAFYRDNNQIGTITLNGTTNVSYDTSSDYRLKENIEPMTGSIARLKQIKPSTFNFISEPDRSCEGFIAHELAEIVPNAVSGEKDAMRDDGVKIDPQGVDFGRVVPLLVSAVQELTAKVEALENA